MNIDLMYPPIINIFTVHHWQVTGRLRPFLANPQTAPPIYAEWHMEGTTWHSVPLTSRRKGNLDKRVCSLPHLQSLASDFRSW